MVKFGKKEIDTLVQRITFRTGKRYGISYYSGRYSFFYYKDKSVENSVFNCQITEYLKPYVLYHVLKAILRFIETGVEHIE